MCVSVLFSDLRERGRQETGDMKKGDRPSAPNRSSLSLSGNTVRNESTRSWWYLKSPPSETQREKGWVCFYLLLERKIMNE